jgi:tetratricopeptide (TPR) repeat protein
VHVDAATPMTSGEATEVVFGPAHYSKGAELDGEVAEKNDNSFVCGWWHSHPFKSNPQSIFLSSIDVGNHLGFQGPNPLAIALVHDPSKIKERDTPFGIKVFRLTRTDYSQLDLDRLALDLNAEGTTRSNPKEIVYYPIPFEIVGMTPQLFIESLADVFEKTIKGAPPIKAYHEDDAAVGIASSNDPGRLTRIQDLGNAGAMDAGQDDTSGSYETFDDTGEFEGSGQVPGTAKPATLSMSLPEEMEARNMVHVLPAEDFASGDEDLRTEEAEQLYLNALQLKKQKEFKVATGLLRNAFRVYIKLEAKHKMTFIKNELMECFYWNGEVDEAIIESDKVKKLATEIGNSYFLGNAHEFRGRAFLKRGDTATACQAFQEALVAFKKGSFFAKAGQCSELIGRVTFNQRIPDVEGAITFIARALKYYQDAIKNPRGVEPAWARDAFITSHGSMLEKQAKRLVADIKNAQAIKQMKEILGKIGPWN